MTDSEFEADLDTDLGWRRVELSHLKNLLGQAKIASIDGPATRGLSRALVAMCYAHWEGFSKNALYRYSLLVTRRKPRLSQASESLLLEHVNRLMKRIESGDTVAKTAVVEAIRNGSDERLKIDRVLLSDTKSNLRYAVLVNLFERGAIALSQFELRANLIDVRLCDRRNNVAHGRDFMIAAGESLELCDETVCLLEDMRDVIVNQVRTKGYLTAEEAAIRTDSRNA